MSVVDSNDVAQRALQDMQEGCATLNPSQASQLARKAEENLFQMLNDPAGPFMNDPELALKAFSILSKNEQNIVETRRRVADCLIRAKQIISGGGGNLPPVPDNLLGGLPGSPENSAFS